MVKIAPFDAQQLPLSGYSATAVLVDENTHRDCYPRIAEQLPAHTLIRIESGEERKNLHTCQQIWQQMTTARLDRKSLLLNLGGGVIGDMGGFCAATYQRGIDFIQLPTTLLAQVDASVGGKLGVDFQGLKNHIGLFVQPKLVWIDPAFLHTLPERELRSGFAEVIKHCLIADTDKWEEIRSKSLLKQDFSDLIRHSVGVKRSIVEADPLEGGKRKLLNFGHTLGHAVETFFMESGRHKRLLHGEAIAVGMLAESWLATQKQGLSQENLLQIRDYLKSIFGTVTIPPEDFDEILNYTLHDKKNERKQVRAALIGTKIGEAVFDVTLSREEMSAALRAYHDLMSV